MNRIDGTKPELKGRFSKILVDEYGIEILKEEKGKEYLLQILYYEEKDNKKKAEELKEFLDNLKKISNFEVIISRLTDRSFKRTLKECLSVHRNKFNVLEV